MSVRASRRVLHLTASLTDGGLERQLSLLTANLPPRWSPLVWSADGGPFVEVLARTRVPLILDQRTSRFDSWPLVRLAGLILRHRPDVVHCWNWLPATFAAPVCRAAGIPFVDGTIRLGRPNPEFGHPRRSIMRLATVVVANSQAGLDAWGIAPPHGRVVYNGFDPSRLERLADVAHVATGPTGRSETHESDGTARRDGPFTVVMTARMHPHKDFRTLLAAARLLREAAPAGTWRFLLVGDGPDHDELRRDAAELIAEGTVAFVAPGLEVLPLVAAADVGVLLTSESAHAEGCSNSIMEYMACGLPVVANDSGGNRELVTEGVSGFLVPAGDAAALALRLDRLRRAPGRAAMGAAGRERLLRDFSLSRMVDEYVRIYDDCVRGSRRARRHRGPRAL